MIGLIIGAANSLAPISPLVDTCGIGALPVASLLRNCSMLRKPNCSAPFLARPPTTGVATAPIGPPAKYPKPTEPPPDTTPVGANLPTNLNRFCVGPPLADNPKALRTFTKEEQNAIKLAAKGGPTQNLLRFVGKLAPTGVVSGGGSVGLGYLAGGPIGAVVTPVVGGLARKGAEQLGLRNIEQLRNRLATGNTPIPQVSTRGLIGARELAAPIINPITGLLSEE